MTTPETKGEQLICEACGEELLCGAKTGNCWCFDIMIDPAALEDLRSKFQNCLCQDCLKNKIELLLPDSTPTEN